MKLTKRLLSLVLCLALMASVMANVGVGFLDASATVEVTNEESGHPAVPQISVVVPEVIYLNPGTTSFGQYLGGGINIGSTATATGTIEFLLMDTFVDWGTEIRLSYNGASSVNFSTTLTDQSLSATITGGTASSATTDSRITWTISYTVEGVGYNVSAYTYVYCSWLGQAGTQGSYSYDVWTGTMARMNAYSFITGIHSASGGNATSLFTSNTQHLSGLRTTAPLYAHFTLNGAWGGTSGYVPDGDATDQGGTDSGQTAIYSNTSYFSTTPGGVYVGGHGSGDNTGPSYASDNTGFLTVDASRHTNYSQIPYFTAGVMQFYNANCNDQCRLNSIYTTDGVTLVAQPNQKGNNRSDGLGYGLYSFTGTIPSRTTNYVIRATMRYENDGFWFINSSTINLKLDTNLTVYVVDKQLLREALVTWINKGMQDSDYAPDKWVAYTDALDNAASALGNPKAQEYDISKATNDLEAAGNALDNARRKLTYTVTHMLPGVPGETITVDGVEYTIEQNSYASIVETGTFYSGATVKATINSYTGYNPPLGKTQFIFNDKNTNVNVTFQYRSADYVANYVYDPMQVGHVAHLTSESNPSTKNVTYGTKYGELAEPTVMGWRFDGWYRTFVNGEYSNPVTSNTTVTVNGAHDLYAKWTCRFGGGHGSETDPFLISEYSHLENMSNQAYVGDTTGVYFKQVAVNIDYARTYTLVDTFKGSYDGNNGTITIDATIVGSDYAGLFGRVVDGAVVKNLKVNLGGTIMSNNPGYAGFIGELKDATVENVHINFTGSISGGTTGVIAGQVTSTTTTGATIRNSTVTAVNNVKFFGASANAITNYNNWMLITQLPADTSYDCGCNTMYVKSNNFVTNGTAVVESLGGNIQFTATPNEGWMVEYRDGSGNVIAANQTYTAAYGLQNVKYYIYFIKDLIISGRNTMGLPTVGGTVDPTTAKLEQGEELGLSATAQTGYNFAGWEIQGDSGVLRNATSMTGATFIMGESNVIVYANFKPSEYTVRFDGNNAGAGDTVTGLPADIAAVYDVEYTLPVTIPVRTGWTFVSWSTGPSGTSGTNYDPGDTIRNLSTIDGAVVKLYAIWTHDMFDIRFVPNTADTVDFTLLANQTHGTTFNFPSTTKRGYTFYGWFDNTGFEGIGHEIGEESTVTAAVTYYAKWVANVYIMAFDANGGQDAPASFTATYDTAFNLPVQEPTRTGHTFLGWDIVRAGATVVYSAGQTDIINISTGNDPNGGQVPTYTLYACWEAVTYSVNWKGNGGTPIDNYATLTYGSLYASGMPETEPIRNGYSFLGWYTTADGGEQIRGNQTVDITGDAVFYAHWGQKTFTLRFDKNSVDAYAEFPEDEMADVVIDFGTNYEMPDCTYQRTGFRFNGWSRTTTGSVVYDAGELYNTDEMATTHGETITIFAQWTARKYYIYYNGNGNTSGSTASQQANFGDTINLEANGFIKAGSVFAGWATSQDNANNGYITYGDGAPFTLRTTGVTFYAVWSANQYRVIFNGSGADGGAMGSQLMSYGETAPLFTNAFTKTGYHFTGWTETEGSSTVAYDDADDYTMSSETDKNLYAVWTRNTYTLSFDGNAEDASNVASPITLYYDVDFSFVLTSGSSQTISAPSRPGYDFEGWSTIPGYEATYVINSSYTLRNLTSENGGNVTFYAIWSPCAIPVSWNCNGGLINGSSSYTTYSTFSQTIVFPGMTPTRLGYVFDNWWTEQTDGEQVMGEMIVDWAVSRTFYAHWIAATYTVLYNKNSDDATGETLPTEHVCGVARTVAQNGYVRPGYAFKSWNTLPDGSGATYYGNGMTQYTDLSYSNGAEVTLYAIWERQDVPFTVKFMGQNADRTDYSQELATKLTSKQADSMEYASSYSTRVFTGYTWNNNDNVVRVNGDGTSVLYVYYNRKTYTVTYHSNDGYDDTYTQYFFHDVAQPLTPVSFRQIGYEFDCWSSRANGTGTTYNNAQADVMFSSNVDLYAQWRRTSSEYTVYHYQQSVNGSFPESAKTTQTLQGTSLTVIEAQPMEIQGFVYDSTVSGTISSGMVAVDGSLVLKLYYVRQNYTLTLDPNGAVGDETTVEMMYGETRRLPSVTNLGFSLPGYAFAGWATTPNGDVEYINTSSYVMGAADQRLFAKWQTGLYTIYFDSNGGSTVSNLVAAYGATISAPQPAPIKAGFEFRAWTYYGEDYVFTTMPRENITLVADWTATDVTVSFNIGDATSGTVPQSLTGLYGESFEMPGCDLILNDPTNMVYRRLVGWSATQGSTTGTAPGATYSYPATSTELYPVWSANYYELLDTIALTAADKLPASENNDPTYSAGGQYETLGSPAGFYDRDFYTDESIAEMTDVVNTAQLPINSYFPQANQANVDALTEDVYEAYSNLVLKSLSHDDIEIICPSTPDGNTYPPCYGVHTYNGIKALATTAINSGYYTTYTVNQLNQRMRATDTQISRLGGKYPHYDSFVGIVGTLITTYHSLVLLDASFTEFETLYAGIDRSNFDYYTVEAVQALDNFYIEKIAEKGTIKKPDQYIVDGYTARLQDMIDNLSIRAADYTEVFTQIKLIPPGYTDADLSGNQSATSMWDVIDEEYLTNIYTAESVETLRLAVIAVDWTYDASNQALVSGADGSFEYAIRDAIAGLALKSSSYTVEHYLQKADGTGYELDDSSEISSPEGAIVTATENTYEGFGLNETSSSVSGTVSSTTPLVLTLYYDRLSYAISFNSSGGSAVEAITARYGAPVTAPANPTKTGSTFVGWFTEAAGTNEYSFTTMPLNGITLYAKWTDNIYYINFKRNDGTENNYTSLGFKEGFATNAPVADPTRAGYTFGGWYDTADCNGDPHEFVVMGTADVDVYAKWTANTNTPYSVVHNTETTSGSYTVYSTEPFAGTTGTSISATPLTLLGFELDTQASTLTGTIGGDGNTVLNLYYVRKTYTIEFNTNGGSTITTQSHKFDTVISAPANPTKQGYTFGGWLYNSSVFIFSRMPAENIVLEATWNPATDTEYNVKYFVQNTTLDGYDEHSTDTYTGTTDTSVTAVAKTIAGFTCNNSMGTRTGTVLADGSLVLSIYYTRNSYTISFNSNGGSVVESITQPYGTAIAAPASPIMPGFTFVKWQNEGVDYSFTTMPAESIELTAVWTEAQNTPYTVQHWQEKLDGTFELFETDTLAGATNSTATAETKTYAGYEFSSTNSTSSGQIIANGSLVLVMRYTRKTNTISFETDGGTAISPISAKYGAAVTSPAVNPSKRGFLFNGWITDENQPYTFSTMPAESIVVYADWEVDDNTPYSVEYYWQVVGSADEFELHEIVELSGETGTTAEAELKNYPGLTCDEYSGLLTGTINAEGTLVLQVYYYRDTFMITYYVNDTYYTEDSFEFGAEITAPEPAAPSGYHFSGWTDLPETMPAEDMEVFGSYVLDTFTITYLVEGEIFTTQDYAPNAAIVAPTTPPSKTGYSFNGWIGIPTTMPSEDISVSANFSINSYDVTYKVDGVVYGEPQTYEYGATITPPENPSKTGHRFVRWEGLTETMGADNLTVNAVFALETYTITYKVDDVIYGEPQTYEYGATVTALPDPSRIGATFSGWSAIPETMPNENIIVTGSFTSIDYKISYYVDGVYHNEQTWHYGDTITALEEPTKTGYLFSGWNGVPETMPANNLTVTGAFTKQTYTVYYVLDGEAYDNRSYEYESAVTAIAAPAAREGYTFSGWVGVPETMPANNVTVTGSFNANTYKLTFNVDGVFYDEKDVPFNTAPTLPEDAPSKTGYTFTGWTNLPELMPATALVVEAAFSKNSYKITYELDGAYYNEQIVEYDAAVTALTDPAARVGFVFSGWQNVPETMPANDVTVTGSFSAKTYTMTFNVDGEYYDSFEVEYNTAPTLPETNPSKEGYDFRGWLNVPALMPANDVVSEADFMIKSYSIYYLVDNVLYDTQLYNYDATVTPSAYPAEREGYTFSGWSSNLPAKMPAEDLTVTGAFSPNIYLVSYYLDGALYDSYTKTFGATLTQLDDPDAREGYTFSGWTALPETMPAHNIDISGSFNANTYQVFYYVDGVSYQTSSYKFGDAVTAIAYPPEKTGYTFGGWETVPETMPANDVNVYGVYNVNRYNLNYYYDGEYDSTVQVNYGEGIVLVDAPAKTGHRFVGWSEVPETMPAEDVDVYGTYEALSYKVTFNSEGVYFNEEYFVYDSYITPTIEAPTKTGYNFSGWRDMPEKMPAEDITVEAIFAIASYKLTYFVDGEQYGEQEEYEYMSPLTLREEPAARQGYTFTGWSALPETMPAYDVSVEGNFVLSTYTATYYIDSEFYLAQPYHFGDTIVPPTDTPTRAGYTFSGWDYIPETMPDNHIDINGTFNPNTYYITYKIDGETIDTVPCVYTHQIETIEAPQKEGYNFDGWNDVPATMPAEDIEITGTYSRASFDVIYYVDNAEYARNTFEYEEEIVPLSPLGNRPGFVFIGWSDIPEFMPSYDVEVFGEYIEDRFVLTYMLNGEQYDEQTYASGETVVAPTAPTAPTGYVFAGWAGLPGVMPTRDVTVIGSFEKGIFTITYYVDGDQYGEPESYEYEAPVTPRAVPEERTGYEFSGWIQTIPETMPGNNLGIYGNFTAKEYEINYYIDGQLIGTTYHAYLSAVTPMADPERPGYTFNGWVGVPEVMPAENVDVMGSYTINQYTITYYVDNEFHNTQTYNYDEVITPLEDPTLDGYTFSGWTDIPARMPASNLNVYGSFARDKAVVNFSLNGGTGTLPEAILDTIGTAVTLPAQGDISFGSREFLGWATSSTATAADVLTSFNIPEGGATLYAIWEELDVSLLARDGSGAIIDRNRGYIYGINTGTTRTSIENTYLEVTGDGDIVYSSLSNRLGTGTVITLVDASGMEIESFILIIFGDVDGNANVTSADMALINEALTAGFEEDYQKFAANIVYMRRNDLFNSMDAASIHEALTSEGLDQAQIAATIDYYS